MQWKELHNSDRRRYRNKRPVDDEEKGGQAGAERVRAAGVSDFSQQEEVLRNACAKYLRKLISTKSCTNATVEDTK